MNTLKIDDKNMDEIELPISTWTHLQAKADKERIPVEDLLRDRARRLPEGPQGIPIKTSTLNDPYNWRGRKSMEHSTILAYSLLTEFESPLYSYKEFAENVTMGTVMCILEENTCPDCSNINYGRTEKGWMGDCQECSSEAES